VDLGGGFLVERAGVARDALLCPSEEWSRKETRESRGVEGGFHALYELGNLGFNVLVGLDCLEPAPRSSQGRRRVEK
jgi:hypothetical protein